MKLFRRRPPAPNGDVAALVRLLAMRIAVSKKKLAMLQEDLDVAYPVVAAVNNLVVSGWTPTTDPERALLTAFNAWRDQA